jgi:hypothetical protein
MEIENELRWWSDEFDRDRNFDLKKLRGENDQK